MNPRQNKILCKVWFSKKEIAELKDLEVQYYRKGEIIEKAIKNGDFYE